MSAPVAVAQDFRQPARGLMVDEPEGLSKRYVQGHGAWGGTFRRPGVGVFDRRMNGTIWIGMVTNEQNPYLCPREPWKVPLH